MRASWRSLVLFAAVTCSFPACGDDYNPMDRDDRDHRHGEEGSDDRDDPGAGRGVSGSTRNQDDGPSGRTPVVPRDGNGPDNSTGGGSVQTRVTPGTATLQFINQTPSMTVTGLFLAPSGNGDLGPNQLENDTIPPGARWSLSSVPCDEEFDMQLIGTGSFEAEAQALVFDCDKVTVFTLKP